MDNIIIQGKIVRGFKRGSKQLGCPTANIEMTEINKELRELTLQESKKFNFRLNQVNYISYNYYIRCKKRN